MREFFQTTYYQPSRALFISNVACILMHERFNPDTRFTDFLVTCILMHERFNLGACLMISCNKLHATIHDQITHGTLFNPFGHFRFRASRCTLRSRTKPRTERYLTFSDIHNFVQQVARYDPRSTHARYEIKCGDFCVCFFKQHIINRQERYSFRATSCTLRSTINPRTVRNKVRWFLRVFFQTTHYQPSRALFISCNKLHATILAWIQTEATCLALQGHYDLSRINTVER